MLPQSRNATHTSDHDLLSASAFLSWLGVGSLLCLLLLFFLFFFIKVSTDTKTWN